MLRDTVIEGRFQSLESLGAEALWARVLWWRMKRLRKRRISFCRALSRKAYSEGFSRGYVEGSKQGELEARHRVVDEFSKVFKDAVLSATQELLKRELALHRGVVLDILGSSIARFGFDPTKAELNAELRPLSLAAGTGSISICLDTHIRKMVEQLCPR